MVVAVLMFQTEWAAWYPWALPGLVANGLEAGEEVMPRLLVGWLEGPVVVLLGGWDVVRRDVL